MARVRRTGPGVRSENDCGPGLCPVTFTHEVPGTSNASQYGGTQGYTYTTTECRPCNQVLRAPHGARNRNFQPTYRGGGNMRRYHTGGRPHSHRPRRRPLPIPGGGNFHGLRPLPIPGGPGMPPPSTPAPIYRRGGGVRRYNDGGYVSDYSGPGPDAYDYYYGHDGYVGNVPHIQEAWSQGYGQTPMIIYRSGGSVTNQNVCNGPSTGIDEFGNNIC